MRSISFSITALNESKKPFTDADCFSGIKIIPIPKNIAKNMICNMLRLSPAAAKIFEGTMSTRACKGPAVLCFAAASRF